jgi:alanine-glyoxylate transaminase/serine-glyoxylate transaminase/serine-pyruvate transaminase
MPQNASRLPGRHFLQIPGPTPVPDRVLRAIDMPLIDQRGPEFAKMTKRVYSKASRPSSRPPNR